MQTCSRSSVFRSFRSRPRPHSFPFRLSMSRVMDFLNILASNAVVPHGGDQNLVAGLRFENAANMRSCHSNHPCCRRIHRTTPVSCPCPKLYILSDAPSFPGLNRSCSIGNSLLFSRRSSLVILSFTSHWLGCLTFLNSTLLSNTLCDLIHSFTSQPRRLSINTPQRNTT
ncbi:hypothetical protein P154DRAFT_151886 [Amniculicola lignicola CBS 123094]|uniref:Uncharacterized protein n=1 Tax=Amniculicola lignicola CBS 123094 TaxID=1392246 RepID=A0A6A5WKG2_9PLEO|nr:hypothetical protein P154DRAFT_151886 [Amniculicola lignicola CBS 123094]